MTITLSPPHDPIGFLSAPSIPSDGSFVAELEQKAGVIIGGVDGIIHTLTGFSPLAEWVAKPFGGDWDALDRGAVAWTSAGKAVSAIADNVSALPSQFGNSWKGASAESFARAQHKVCSAIKPLPHACDSMSKMCGALSKAARAIADFVAEILGDLAEFMVEMLASLAVPIAGEIAMPAWITLLLSKIAEWVPELSEMIASFFELMEELPEIVKDIQDAIEAIQKILEVLESALEAVSSAIDASKDADSVLA